MRKFFDRLGAIFIGLFLLTLIEGIISLGTFLKFEEYNALAWFIQFMAVYVTCWVAVRIQESQS